MIESIPQMLTIDQINFKNEKSVIIYSLLALLSF